MNALLFTIIKDKAVDYYRDRFGTVYSIISDHEESTFSFRVHNQKYKNLVDHSTYEELSERVEQINYRLDFDFNHYGITLPIKQVKAIKYVTKTDKPFNNLFKVTYEIIDVKEDEPYFTDWASADVYKSVHMYDCGKKLIDFLENMFFKDAFVMAFNDRAKRFTIAMHKDFRSITDYFILTNVESCPDYELFFRCIKTYSSKVNPDIAERTYILDSIRPKKNITVKCKDQTFKCIGRIVDDWGDFTEANSYTSDPVNHPNHYEMVGPFESFDIIVESLGIEGARYFCQGNVIKYQTRYKEKNGEEDLRKRHWYSRMDQMLAKCKTIEDYYKLKESDF